MLIGRDNEQKLLLSALDSDESKFIAVYGRRRVGKTYLIRQTFKKQFTFSHTGLYRGNLQEQLFGFSASLRQFGLSDFSPPNNWLEAFELLKDLINTQNNNEKKIIFLDELSWMDTTRSDLMLALESFWNGWASARDDIVLIVCASATSWMLSKVIHNKGGLYNRLAFQLNLKPFSLKQCEEYLAKKGNTMNRHQILQCYMIMGGIPYYWGLIRNNLSFAQNIDYIFFSENAPLKNEFNYLFSSIFKHPDSYIKIIEALGTKKAGMDRNELLKATNSVNSGSFSTKLDELESCGFIRQYPEYGKKKRNTIYQLMDNFVLFYYQFMADKPNDVNFWTHQINTPTYNTFCGLAFERVCLQHIGQIKNALGISAVLSNVCSWKCTRDVDKGINGSQVDLLIDRKDQVINLCEMKFSGQQYSLSKSTDENLRHKLNDFINVTQTKSAIHLTLITPYGLANNSYSGNIQSVITEDDLFNS